MGVEKAEETENLLTKQNDDHAASSEDLVTVNIDRVEI